MARNKEKKSRRGCFRFVFGIFKAAGILVLLMLIAAVTVGIHLYRSMRDDPVTVRRLEEYRRAQVECEPGRISFSEDGTMTQSYSADEIMWLFTRVLGNEKIDVSEYVNRIPGLTFRGVALETDGEDAVLCAEGDISGVRIVLRSGIVIRPELTADLITLIPEWFSAGKIKIPVSLIDSVIRFVSRFIKADTAYTGAGGMEMSFGYQPVVLQRVASMKCENGRFVISGPMSTSLIDSHVLELFRIRLMRLTQTGEELAGPVIDTEGDDPAYRYASLLPLITDQPEKYIEFLEQFFPLCSEKFVKDLFEKDFGIAKMWFPEPDHERYAARRQELLNDYYRKVKYMRTICDKTSNGFYYGRYTIKKDGTYYQGKNFDPYAFYGAEYSKYRTFLDIENARICTVRRTADERQAAGMLLRGADGGGYLVEFYTAVEYDIYPLNEGMFTQMMQAEETPEIILTEYSLSAPKAEEGGWV